MCIQQQQQQCMMWGESKVVGVWVPGGGEVFG